MPSPRFRTETATIIGFAAAFGSIVVATLLNTGSVTALRAFLHLGPVVLIVGGTVGVTFVSFPLSDLRQMLRLIWMAVRPPDTDLHGAIAYIAELADHARRKGLLSLQDEADHAPDPLVAHGINLLADGADSETLYEVLSAESRLQLTRQRRLASMFDAAGGYAPTIGIVGTVMELVHVLPNMSDAASLGKSIAGAFLATFYGIVTANYFWLPIGRKLRNQSLERETYADMVIEGLLMIQNGRPSRFLRERLLTYTGDAPAPRRPGALPVGEQQEVAP